MTDKRKESQEPEQPDATEASPPPAGAGAVLEPAPAAIERLEAQQAELTDRHLRLAAEYDNFRRRTAKERAEMWAKAQADLLSRLVDALDDLARFARVDPVQTDGKAMHEGVNLVERKIWKELEGAGVQRIDAIGVAFDPRVHEAVVTAPARERAQDQTVGAVLQTGYKLGEILIRPARVQVLTWGGEA
jgi:molecular chaperone GrpE